MGRRLRLPGGRDARATLDETGSTACVVAAPPHPQLGGDRTDARLRAVSDALGGRDVDCLRIDYGPWDESRGEATDVRTALGWVRERYDAAGLFGYSFGGAVALLAAAAAFRARETATPDAVSVLAPASTVGGREVPPAVGDIDCPLQVVSGERDDAVDSAPVADRAHERGAVVETLPADHFYVGQRDTVGGLVAGFLADRLRA